MDQILYPYSPVKNHRNSFAWTSELALKTGAAIIFLANAKDFESQKGADEFNLQILDLYGHYQNHYNRWENGKQLKLKTIMNNGGWPDLIFETKNRYSIKLTVIREDFEPINEDFENYACIRLPKNLKFGGFAQSLNANDLNRTKNHEFYRILSKVRKKHLSKEFLNRLSKDRGLFNFFVDFFGKKRQIYNGIIITIGVYDEIYSIVNMAFA